MPGCCVVVVGYQGERWLPDCLETLAGASSRPLRLVLVDNGGNGQMDRLPLGRFDTTVVATPRPMGFADANNLGLVEGGLNAEAVCFLNQDTVGEPGWLDACLDVLERDAGVGAVSPLLKTFDGQEWDEGFASCVRGSPEFGQSDADSSIAGTYDVASVTAAAMVVRSDVLMKVGPFDPIFGSYYEDFDLCRRITGAGYRIVVSGEGTVRHFGGSSTQSERQNQRRMRLIIRNRAIHRIRGEDGIRWWSVLRQFAAKFPRNVLRGFAGTPSSQPVAVQCQAHLDLLQLLPRLVSRARDEQLWQRYLKRMNWQTSAIGTERPDAANFEGQREPA